MTTAPPVDPLLAIALDLTASLATRDRYDRLLAAAADLIPCDAAALLSLDGDSLVPVATRGLTDDASGRRFAIRDHPRLAAILRAPGPLRFPPDSSLPDPFDGLLAADPTGAAHVHACLGCPLRVEGELVGVLTADALKAHRFDHLDPNRLWILGALAGAALRTSQLIEALETSSARLGQVALDLVRDANAQRGGTLLGTSSGLHRLRTEMDLVARTDLTVLVVGETGVGKELVARGVHAASARAGEPLLYVNCAALPESIAESELFGHVRGAFTGAEVDRAGKFEVANGGTLMLDEIGELPPSLQPKLLRALQEGEIQRVGADRPAHVDVRVIAVTNRDLEAEARAGRFRADLYHRLNEYPLVVPPLRHRTGDVALLAGHFLDLARRRHGLGPLRLTPAAREALLRYAWPGNVRELRNVLARAALRRSAGTARAQALVLDAHDLGPEFAGPGAPAAGVPEVIAPDGMPYAEAVDEFKRRLVSRAIEQADGNRAAAARALGLHRSNLHRLASRLRLP